tara:strand:- start:3069 stop:4034 length:966 start_codon:yes stop_codon:yes gene_type:complete
MDIDEDLLYSQHFDKFQLSIDNYYNNNNKNNIDIPESSKLLISVMSATCNLGNKINLQILCDNLVKDHNLIDINPSHQITRKKSNTVKKKIFYNQTTLYIRPWYNIDNKYNLDILVNLKLFRNGKCQMCGLRNIEDGIQTIKILLKCITNECIGDDDNKNIYDIEEIKKNFSITLINSDFDIGFKIDRKKLFDILLNEYELFVTYDPCHYQGVNLKYFINYEQNKNNTGKCLCVNDNDDKKIICNGKGNGDGNGNCKKITISIFQSGNIIVTGKCSLIQLDEAYDFIINICHKHFEDIYQPLLCNDIRKIKRRSIRLLERK